MQLQYIPKNNGCVTSDPPEPVTVTFSCISSLDQTGVGDEFECPKIYFEQATNNTVQTRDSLSRGKIVVRGRRGRARENIGHGKR